MITLAASLGVFALALVGLVAHRQGRRRGRIRLPAGLVAELRTHKLVCMGELPERVALEIELLGVRGTAPGGNRSRSPS